MRLHSAMVAALLLGAGCKPVEIDDLPTRDLSTPTAETPTPTAGDPTPSLQGPTPTLTAGTLTPTPRPPTPTPTEGVDGDGDGYPIAVDCADDDPQIHPEAAERCDSKDQDCDEKIDEGALRTFYEDRDGDNYGDPDAPVQGCVRLAEQAVTGDDCDDADPQVHPQAPESCDGQDQDCDDAVDEGALLAWYSDSDLDGFGGGEPTLSCEQVDGLTAVGDDCDDANPRIHPGVPFEIQDLVDNDCDGAVDEVQLADTAAKALVGSSGGGWLGSGMSGAGDVDNDGIADLIFGEPIQDGGRGQARLIYGGGGAFPGEGEVVLLSGDESVAGAGLAVAGWADVNGDGFSDVAIGQPWRGLFSGRVTVVEGSGERLTGRHNLKDVGVTIDGDFGINLGNSVAFADMDRDDYDDLVIGAPYTNLFTGRAHLIFGSPDGLSDGSNKLDIRSDSTYLDGYVSSPYYGYSMATVGDFDGDGFEDVAISAPSTVLDFSDETRLGTPAAGRTSDDPEGGCDGCGAVTLMYGGPRDDIGHRGHVSAIYGVQAADGFGMGVGGVPDLNGDGYDELVIGAPFFNDDGLVQAGRVWVFFGRLGGLPDTLKATDADLTITCPFSGCNLGHLYTVAGVGDVDGDSRGDLFVGGVGGDWGIGQEDAGLGALLFGRVLEPGRMSIADLDVLFQGAGSVDTFGSAARIGDLDADGHADLALGAYRKKDGGKETGWIYLFPGY